MAACLRTMLACLLLAACRWSHADAVVVYRCVAADGAVALQDRPCPPAATQARSERPRPAATDPASVPAAPPTEEAVPAAAAPAAVPAPPPPAPPPLWDCVRHDGSRYESDTGVPERRWVPLWVLGRDPLAPPALFGAPATRRPAPRREPVPAVPAGVLGPGAWVEDRCRLLPAEQACQRYAAQRAELRRQWQRAMPSGRDRLAPHVEALSALLRRSCGR